jgi:integrase
MKLRKLPIYEADADGRKFKRPSKKFYGVFVDFSGQLRRVPLFQDRGASKTLADNLDRLNSLRAANEKTFPRDVASAVDNMPAEILAKLGKWDILPASRVAAGKPLAEHVGDWKSALLAKGNSDAYAKLAAYRVQRIVDGCRLVTISDVSASAVQGFIAGLRQDIRDEKGRTRRGISAATFNYYLRDARSFFRWMVDDRRATDSPLAHLKGVNAKTDRRHDRRAISTNELRQLLDSTGAGVERFGMTGPARVMLYRLAVETGLRANELRSLTRASFQLDGDDPAVSIAAAYAKNRRQDTLPLRRETAAALAAYFTGKMPTVRAFNVPPSYGTAEMFKADLTDARTAWIAAAGSQQERGEREESTFLAYIDDAGHYADFHALRHTFISNLASGGVHPKTAQRLARHSTITLTMDRYTHLRRDDLAEALTTLPDFSSPARQVAVATGTDGKSLSPSLSPDGAIQRNPCTIGANNLRVSAGEEVEQKPLKIEDFAQKQNDSNRSSVGQSSGFLIRRSQVRILPVAWDSSLPRGQRRID